MNKTSKLLLTLGVICSIGTLPQTQAAPIAEDSSLSALDTDMTRSGSLQYAMTCPGSQKVNIRATQPNFCAKDVQQWSGYVDLPNSRHLFFWYFESKEPSNETMLWLNGGPGASSILGEAGEIGPCLISKDDGGVTLVDNEYSWNAKSNLLFIDQPAGVGYSYVEDGDHVVGDSETAAKDVYEFLQIWFDCFKKDAHLHIAGESFAGRYIPTLATYIMDQNQNKENIKVPLKSILMGNTVTSPTEMFKSYYDAACTPKSGYGPVLNETICEDMYNAWPQCETMLNDCANDDSNNRVCSKAFKYCAINLMSPYDHSGLNFYDMRVKGEYLEPELIGKYFNMEKVKSALGVDPSIKYNGLSLPVFDQFLKSGDRARSSVHNVVELLDKYDIPVMIFNGDADFSNNWLAEERWTLSMNWTHHNEFNEQPLAPWYATVNGKPEQAGVYRSYGKLTFVKVFGAGHLVAFDKPQAALALSQGWVNEGPYDFTDKLSKPCVYTLPTSC